MAYEKSVKNRTVPKKTIFIIVATMEGREPYLYKFLSTLGKIKLAFRLVVVRQYTSTRLSLDEYDVLNITEYGASNARNVGFEYCSDAISESDYVFFPDDDCFFVEDIDDPDLIEYDLALLNLFSPSGVRLGFDNGDIDNKYNLFYRINCPRFILKASLFRYNQFNVDYGPGSKIPATEETELFFRIFSKYPKMSVHESNNIIFHPHEIYDFGKLNKYSYSQGYLLRQIMRSSRLYALSYSIALLRPIAALVVYSFHSKKRVWYFSRLKSVVKGFFER